MKKQEIIDRLEMMRETLLSGASRAEPVSIRRYEAYSRAENGLRVWTDALQKAVNENSCVRIEPSEEPYYIDAPVILPSGCHIIAHGARVELVPGCVTLMLRNGNVVDGSSVPEDKSVWPDHHITIEGGTWADCENIRRGYGKTGKFEKEGYLEGVTALMLFSNVTDLLLRDMIFVHTSAFSVQIGNAERVCTEDIRFEKCFADGVHLNGNIRDILVRNISGYVGDDLVALNPYDWDNSGINFGPAECILIDGVFSSPDSPYKAIRMLPAVYRYKDGTKVDCLIGDMVLRRVSGIVGYKLYLQTDAYIDAPAHPADVGSCGDMYFEELDIDLDRNIDSGIYEKVRYSTGYNIFGAFEVLANVEKLEFENIRLTLHKDILPESCLVSVGPKSMTGGGDSEVFDPYLSCHVGELIFRNITVNGEKAVNRDDLVRVVTLRPNPDWPRTKPRGGNGKGTVDRITIE